MDIPNPNYTIPQHDTTCVLFIIHIDLLRNNLVQYYKLKAHYATSGISSLFSWFWHAHFSTQRPLQLRSRYFTTLS